MEKLINIKTPDVKIAVAGLPSKLTEVYDSANIHLNMDFIEIRKLIQKIEYEKGITAKVLEIYGIKHSCDVSRLLNLYDENKNIILNESQLAITGYDLMELGIFGKNISTTKKKLFDAVTQDKVANNYQDLIYVLSNI